MAEKARRITAGVGDVVRIPISSDEYVYGQVVDQEGPEHLVVVFQEANVSPHQAMASGFDLAAIVFDALIRNGAWPIVANLPPVDVDEPWFFTGNPEPGGVGLVSFDHKRAAIATPAEMHKYATRHVSYAMVLQIAAEAAHGHRDWNPDLDFMRQLAAQMQPRHPRLSQPLTEWRFEVDEVSASVFRVRGRDALGRSVERIGTDPEALLDECRNVARRLSLSEPDPKSN